MKVALRLMVGLAMGYVVTALIWYMGVAALRAFWPEYAAAIPTRQYTVAMLISRILIEALGTAAAACVATAIAGDKGRAAWWLGGLLLATSLPLHLHYVWNDFPVWYHLIILSSVLPIAGFSAQAWLKWKKLSTT